MDTVEVACPWSALPAMYDAMRDAVLAVHPEVHFGAHWSHAYADGVCQYMTLRLPPMENELGIALHARIWDRLQMLALEHQAAIAHHHGAGLFRNPWIAHDLGAPGMQMLQAIKDAVDPANLFNPGKLGLRASPSVV